MYIFQKIKFWLSQPSAYHCKSIGDSHKWRSPTKNEQFPVCIKCGKSCWWLRGYTMNSGTRLERDNEAIALMDSNNIKLRNIPFNSLP